MRTLTGLILASAMLCSACSGDDTADNAPPNNETPNNATPDSGNGNGGDASDNAAVSDMSSADDVGSASDASMPDAGPMDDAANADGGLDAAVPDTGNPPNIYVGSGDPYSPGPLTVVQTALDEDATGPPVDVVVFAPEQAGDYAVLVFQHGFQMRNSYYATMLSHVASHGFVVVAPQMYEPALFGNPTAAEEAADAVRLYDWVESSFDVVVDVDVATDHLGLVGHSRGAKVVWLTLEGGYAGATAALGVDPVDGRGGPFGNQARVLDGGLTANLPSLFIGAELSAETYLGAECAPQNEDYEAFYDAAPSPSYRAFVEDYGHLDLLDDQTPGCGLPCGACLDGPDDGAFRDFSAGQIVAFFRLQLQGDVMAESYLTAANGAPVTVQFINK